VVKSTGVTQPCATCGGDASNTTYDANGNIASQTDFNGNLITYAYDLTRNLETSRTEAAGAPLARTITTAWHPTFRLPTQITEPNRVTTFTYDAQGNVTQKTIAAGTLSRTWNYTYNSFGQILTADGPRTDVTDISTYTYDAQGNLATVTNALGHVTRLTAYDAHGRPLTIQDPNGLITQLTYDPRGRLISRLVGTELTQFQYDNVGQLTRIILPDSSFMDYTYDAAHRLIAMTDALGNKISYTLDALGNRIKEDIFDPNNTLTQQRRRVFDSLNRLAQDIGAQNQITAYQYDANGNLIGTTDPLAHTTTQVYDALNRLVQVTDPANGIAKYTYDANDRLTQVMDARNIGTAYSYDGLDNLTQIVSLDAGAITHTYDAAGNLITQTDARNKKTVYTYDALNRLIKTVFADATSITYQYDAGSNALGRLVKMTDPAGITQWTYDPQGRVITQTQTTGTLNQVLRYGYDVSGRLAQLIYPSGKVISYGYDLAGNLAQLSLNGQPLLNTIRYQPYGAVKEWTWSNGTLHSRIFDTDGRIISASDPRGQGNAPLSISYDSAGRLVQQTQSTGVHSYGYDSIDRLTQHVDSTGLVSNYQYDANGNRTQLTQGSLATAYNLSITSNRLNSQSGTANKSYAYDAAGNLTGVLTSTGAQLYAHNARGRLAASILYDTVQSARITTYAHNGLGQRIRKTGTGVSTGTHRYVYDAQGHLLGDYNSTGAALQETVYLGDIPVAVLQGTAVYNLHADHLNTPRVITDSTNKVIWRWDSDPFGATQANEDPDNNGVKFTYNLRFPGQYFDKETGLHYNYFRDYDPKIGRYVQSDPIGLEGGLNTYTYALGNPISNFDPDGLRVCYAFYCIPDKPSISTKPMCNKDGDTPCEKGCMKIYESDSKRCRAIKHPAGRVLCWATIATKLGVCLKGCKG
jgi:RHS repeat-associated protein